MARTVKLLGIYDHHGKWQAVVHIGGTFKCRTFPKETPLAVMRAWREDCQAEFRSMMPASGSFAADIEKYLTRIASMPTYKQRAAHLALWAQELGRDRSRNSITAAEIDAVMQQWLITPSAPDPGRRGRRSSPQGIAPGTIRKRRTSLQSFFATMNGKASHNPVKGTTNPRQAPPEVRAIDYALIERAIAAMPDRLSAKPGVISPLSLAKVRARVMAYTGLPPGLIKTILPSDIHWQEGMLRVRARRKGRGVEARTLPLTPQGLEALRHFHAANAYGPFTTSNLNLSFKRACRQVGLDPTLVRLYDLRHSFLTEMYRVTRDIATVARLGMHAAGSPITARYTQGAHEDVDRAAVAALGQSFADQRQAASAGSGTSTASTLVVSGTTLAKNAKLLGFNK